jgi:hypothetical protein
MVHCHVRRRRQLQEDAVASPLASVEVYEEVIDYPHPLHLLARITRCAVESKHVDAVADMPHDVVGEIYIPDS